MSLLEIVVCMSLLDFCQNFQLQDNILPTWKIHMLIYFHKKKFSNQE